MAMEALRIAAKESKFMKFILGGFIFLAVGGLVFTDVQGYFRGGLPNTTVARVGDTEIHIRDFDQGVRGFIGQTGLSMEEAYKAGLMNAYLDNRINQTLSLQEAQDLDIVVGDKFIAKQIREVFPNASKDEIQASLRARGMSEAQMASILTQQIQTTIIDQAPAVLKNQSLGTLTQALARYDSERRSGTTYTFPASKLVEDIEISDTDIENHYEGVKATQYAIPETRVFTIGTVTADQIKKTLPTLTDEDLRADYESRESDFIVSEKRSLAQAVVNDPDHAQKIYELASAGTPLSKALKDVTGEDKGYRDVAPYELNGLPQELAAPSFAADVKVGDVLPPVKTLLGWHVMKITKITPETLKSFTSVKKDLKEELSNARLYDALYEKILETEELLDSGSDFSDLASKTPLKTKDTNALSKRDGANFPESLKEALEVSSSVLDEIYNLPEGGASYPIETGDDQYIVIGVKTVNEANFTPLADVKEDIAKQLKSDRMNASASQNVETVIAQLQSGDLTAKDIVKKYGAKTKPFKNATRKSDNAVIFNAQLNGFSAAVADNTVTIATVTEIDFAGKKSEKNTFSLAGIIDSLFRSYLRDQSDISVNQELLKAQYSAENL